MYEYLNSNPLLAILLIISIGYIFGSIRIKGVSLGTSAILFIGIFAGIYGIRIPNILKILGLALFIYSIGLQAGPKLRTMFKVENLKLEFLAFLIVLFGALITLFSILFLKIDKNLSIGIFAGALTSTPGLAAAYEATGSSITSIGYSIAYPLGVIGVIIFLKLLQVFYRNEIRQLEIKEVKSAEINGQITYKQIVVQNSGVISKTLKELKIPESFNCVISRIIKNNRVFIPTKDTKLEKGDILRLVGKQEDIERVSMFLGKITEEEIPKGNLIAMRFIITNKKLVGKRVEELRLKCSFNANITRIIRSGIEFTATKNVKLEWGDRVVVVGEQNSKEYFKKYFGDDVKKIDEVNVFSIILGLAIGIIIGLIPVSFGHLLSFKLGLTGGILISSLILSNIGKLGPILWRAPQNIIVFIREIGLIFFLTSVGCSAGGKFIIVLKQHGIGIFLWGAVVTFLPMVLIFLISIKMFKVNILNLLGLIPAGMTSTPGFATATSMTTSDLPATVYATVYPVAMLSMILFSKLLSVIV